MKAIGVVLLALLGSGALIVFGLAYMSRKPVEDDDLITGGHL
jgi:hypothetical protein